MAFRHGKYAELVVNTNQALSTFCDSLSIKFDTDTADTTTFGSTWKSSVVGTIGGSFDISGAYDGTVTTGPSAILGALLGAAPFACVAYPGGNVAGQRSYTGNAILTSFSESSPVKDKVSFSASFLWTGTVTPATI